MLGLRGQAGICGLNYQLLNFQCSIIVVQYFKKIKKSIIDN